MIHKMDSDDIEYPFECPYCKKLKTVTFYAWCFTPRLSDFDDTKPYRQFPHYRSTKCDNCGNIFRVGVMVPQNVPDNYDELVRDLEKFEREYCRPKFKHDDGWY